MAATITLVQYIKLLFYRDVIFVDTESPVMCPISWITWE